MASRASPLDRAWAHAGYRLHAALGGRLRPAREVAHRIREEGTAHLAALRYRLRRDGFTGALLAECFALVSPAAPAEALAAARQLVDGGIVELADPAARRLALALAARARALAGERVHLLAASDAAASALAESIGPLLAPLGVRVACLTRETRGPARRELYAAPVLCAAHRELALDYLRDGLRAPERRGALRASLERLSAREALPPLGALQSALVADAELVMLDDAQAPIVITAQADAARERLMYEQALELARTLAAETDFAVEEGAIRLTVGASLRLERLVAPLGGVWSAKNRREELVAWAIEALHFLSRDVDYRVDGERVVFPPPEPGAEEPGPDELEVRKLVEVKEGCRLSSRPDVLARLSVPTFLARYPALGGVCADASGLEPEFWTVYSLKTWRLGRRAAPREPACRVFVTAVAKRAALLQHARSIFAVRTRAEGQSLQEALKVAGVEAPVIALPLLQALPPELSGRDLVVAELPLAARHVAQAAEACAAQSCTLMLSLEDELVARGIAPAWAALARLAVRGGEELSPRWARWIARRAQLALEHSQRAARQDLKARERLLEDLLAVSGRPE